MKRTVYKVTNKINGKIYIGVHSTNNLDESGKKKKFYKNPENRKKQSEAMKGNTNRRGDKC